MKETIYVKYNRTRKPLFQIRTSIIEENGKLWVEKTALIPDAKAHLCSLSKKQTALERHFTNLKPVRTELSEDGGTVRFPFIQGETLAEILGRKIQNGMAPVKEIQSTMEQLFAVPQEAMVPFTATPEFEDVFGKMPELSGLSYPCLLYTSRVACETAVTTGLVLVMGEITTKAYVDIQKIVRETVRERCV